MANHPQGRGREAWTEPAGAADPPPVPQEPPVRRWPHPVNGMEPARAADPMLHYIRCALSYQNQQLADIKALLQQLVVDREDEPGK
ncbi:hypothetical protein [Dysosmobacter sp. Sow4_B12]|uniref:hypothetical protein n=1 Tax=Dysosmobacter sp. Sow4_B12 TaxID=3438777 RepID=UPI003F9156FE